MHSIKLRSNIGAQYELVRLGDGQDVNRLASILACKSVNLPIKYLGLLLGAKYKDVSTWDPVVARFEQCLVGWKRNVLSSKGDSLSLETNWSIS